MADGKNPPRKVAHWWEQAQPGQAKEGIWDWLTVPDYKPHSDLPRRREATSRPDPATGWNTFISGLANVVDPRSYLRVAKRSVQGALSSLNPSERVRQQEAMNAIERGRLIMANHYNKTPISDRAYLDFMLSQEARDADPENPMASVAGVAYRRAPRMTPAQIKMQADRDVAMYNAFANYYTSVDPRTGRRSFDQNKAIRLLAENPQDLALILATAGRGTAAALPGAGMTVARTARRIAGRGEMAAAEEARLAARLAGTASAINKAATVAQVAGDPIGSLGLKAVSTAAPRVVRAVTRRTSNAYDPQFSREFEAYKNDVIDKRTFDHMDELYPDMDGYNSADFWQLRKSFAGQVNAPDQQDILFNDFLNGPGEKWRNPFTPQTSAAIIANGGDPAYFAPPSRAAALQRVIRDKGGVNSAIVRQGMLEAEGVEPGTVTTYTATGEIPPAGITKADTAVRREQLAALPSQTLGKPQQAEITGQWRQEQVPAAGDVIPAGKGSPEYTFDPERGWTAGKLRLPDPVQGQLTSSWQATQTPQPGMTYGDFVFNPESGWGRSSKWARETLTPNYPLTGGPSVPAGSGSLARIAAASLAPAATAMMMTDPKLAVAIGAATGAVEGTREVLAPRWRAWRDRVALDRLQEGAPLYGSRAYPDVLRASTPVIAAAATAQGVRGATPNITEEDIKELQLQEFQRQHFPNWSLSDLTKQPPAPQGKIPEVGGLNTGPAGWGKQSISQPAGEKKPSGMLDVGDWGKMQSPPDPNAEPQRRGGRIQRKSGGQVTVKGIEPMVQKLILKARQAKAGHGKQTEPLLDEHDNTITKALDVAQRAI